MTFNWMRDSFVGKAILKFLRNSSRVHLRQDDIQSVNDVIDLIDRFIDGDIRYPLEWDDFISWDHSNPQIDAIKERIGNSERLLLSPSKKDRELYKLAIIQERNKAAAELGLPLRMP